jgi:SAM-dependent methyltransferase
VNPVSDLPPTAVVTHNQQAWDERARERAVFTRPATEEELAAPLKHLDPRGWYGPSVENRRVLCLGAGGGRHGPLLASAGAEVTVVDISAEMLAIDREMAARHALHFRTVQASIDDLSLLQAASFDLVVQPVSTCYVPDVVRVYREVARVLTTGGTYVSQHKNPTSLQCNAEPVPGGYLLQTPYYAKGPLPPAPPSRLREQGTLEYLHRLEDLIGGLCRSGLSLEELVEVRRGDAKAEPGTFEHRCHYIAPYLRMRAVRRSALTV